MHSPLSPFLHHTVTQLDNNGVQVWLIDFERFGDDEEVWRTGLIDEEQKRAARYRFARDRKQYAVTRMCLRSLLASYLETKPLTVEIQYAEHGKPYLSGPHGDLQFNVSH